MPLNIPDFTRIFSQCADQEMCT